MCVTDKEQIDTGLAKVFNALLKNVHTSLPGIVVSFDPSVPSAKVQPALKRVFVVGDEPVNLPECIDVPVIFPGSGDYWLTVDLKPGSSVLLMFSERAIAAWKREGGILDPELNRMFNLSDAFCIAGILPASEKLDTPVESDCIALRKKDNSVYVKVESDKVTCRVDSGTGVSQNLEIEATGVKSKPTGAVTASEMSAYALAPVPGYVELTKHTHNVTAVGVPSGPPIPTGGATP